MTGVTTRYTFDSSADYEIPAEFENVLVGEVYYEFDGWYDNPDYNNEPIAVIPANTYDINCSKYYTKWSPVTTEAN